MPQVFGARLQHMEYTPANQLFISPDVVKRVTVACCVPGLCPFIGDDKLR